MYCGPLFIFVVAVQYGYPCRGLPTLESHPWVSKIPGGSSDTNLFGHPDV
jgi:hypothetical protein